MQVPITVAGEAKSIEVKEFTVRERREIIREILRTDARTDMGTLLLHDVLMPDCVLERVGGLSNEELLDLGGEDFDKLVRAVKEVNPDFFELLKTRTESLARRESPSTTATT